VGLKVALSSSGESRPFEIDGFSAAVHRVNFLRDPLATARNLYREHGPFIALGPVAGGLPKKPDILAFGAEFNREVLGAPDVWRTTGLVLRGPRDSAQSRLRRGLMLMAPKEHSHYRRMLAQPLERPNVQALGERMKAIVEAEISSWPTETVVDLWPLAQKLVQHAAFSLLFGDDRRSESLMVEMMHEHLRFNFDPAVVMCPIDMPGTKYRKMLQHAEVFEEALLQLVAKKRGCPNQNDLISIVVNNLDENGERPTDTKIASQLPTLFVGAYETCQSVLLWTIVLLAQLPRVACKLHEELRNSDAMGSDKLMELPLLDAVVKESMRMLPPGPVQRRSSTIGTALRGYPVPQGTRVVLSSYLTNRMPDVYTDPDQFMPERWDSKPPSTYEYPTFSAGPRACIGYWFGMNLVKLAIAVLMRSSRVELAPEHPVDYKIRITMEPARGVYAAIRSQDGSLSVAPIRGSISELMPRPLAA
jgi:cytochrome P450